MEPNHEVKMEKIFCVFPIFAPSVSQKNRNIDSVFFSKLTYKYHGKLVSFVEALRTQGFAI